MTIDFESLKEELDKWPLIKSSEEELIAFEDDNGMVHIQTKSGIPRMQMPREVYESLKEYKSGQS